jgi:hypothetical protein
MFSAARSDRSIGDHEPTEARQTNISCIAVMVIGTLALALPVPSLSSSIPVQAPLAQAASVEPALSLMTERAGVELVDKASEAPTQRVPDPACAAQSWPYVCTEAPAGETAQRVRVIAADRTAPSSLVVSASTRPAPVVASATNEQPIVAAAVEETPIQPLGAVTSDAPIAAAPVDVTTPVAAIADLSVTDAAAATGSQSSKSKAAHAKRVRTARSHSRTQSVARTTANGRGALAYNDGGESSDRALGYAAYPQHRMDSYPWAGLR